MRKAAPDTAGRYAFFFVSLHALGRTSKFLRAFSYTPQLYTLQTKSDFSQANESSVDILEVFSCMKWWLTALLHGSCSNWFDLPATQITDEVKRDLRLLRLRGVMDPKRFYKSVDQSKFPKYFQFGTVVEGPTEFYSGQLRCPLCHKLCTAPGSI